MMLAFSFKAQALAVFRTLDSSLKSLEESRMTTAVLHAPLFTLVLGLSFCAVS